jgi:hypothetical protein
LNVNSSEPHGFYERLRLLLSMGCRPQPRLEQIRLKFDRLALSLARPGRFSTHPLFQRHLRTKGEVMNQSYLTSCTRLFGFPCFVRTFLCLIAMAISDRASLLASRARRSGQGYVSCNASPKTA